MRKELKNKIAEQKKDEEKPAKKTLTKEQSFRVWDSLLKDVPEDYDFVAGG